MIPRYVLVLLDRLDIATSDKAVFYVNFMLNYSFQALLMVVCLRANLGSWSSCRSPSVEAAMEWGAKLYLGSQQMWL
jgi:hypothetical protein